MSGIALIVILAVVGVCAYVGIQYIPIVIESGNLDSVLEGVEKDHANSPFSGVQAVEQALNRRLGINDMGELGDRFKVEETADGLLIRVEHERQLNLLYDKQPIPYRKSVLLRR
ncbi:MAG TPA: hypothetical protein VIW02_08470 [Gammaproteobacteria bacterium]